MDTIRWRTASPLWPLVVRSGENDVRFLHPTILRFDTDDFMERVQQVLAEDPATLEQYVAAPETWRDPGAGWEEAESGELKLFQPIHGRFYLVAGSLVCERPGLPDRKVDPGAGDEVGFVIRRVDGAREKAWTVNGDTRWTAVERKDTLAEDEEIQPLFPLPFSTEEAPRRVWAALIPVSSRETFHPEEEAQKRETAEEIRASVVEHWEKLEESLRGVPRSGRLDTKQRQDVVALVQKLTGLLKTQDAVGQATRRTLKELQKRDVWKRAQRGRLPDDLTAGRVLDALETAGRLKFRQSTKDATKTDTKAERRPKYFPASASYRVRFVYRRRACEGIHDPQVSDPTRPFRLAPFLDPDAPQRPVRIDLPPKVGPDGDPLAQYQPSMAFVLSEELQRNIEKAKDADPFKLGKDPVAGDRMCSFSIPIVTICATILMHIIVSLLDLIFSWKPYLKTCVSVDIPEEE